MFYRGVEVAGNSFGFFEDSIVRQDPRSVIGSVQARNYLITLALDLVHRRIAANAPGARAVRHGSLPEELSREGKHHPAANPELSGCFERKNIRLCSSRRASAGRTRKAPETA